MIIAVIHCVYPVLGNVFLYTSSHSNAYTTQWEEYSPPSVMSRLAWVKDKPKRSSARFELSMWCDSKTQAQNYQSLLAQYSDMVWKMAMPRVSDLIGNATGEQMIQFIWEEAFYKHIGYQNWMHCSRWDYALLEHQKSSISAENLEPSSLMIFHFVCWSKSKGIKRNHKICHLITTCILHKTKR